VKLANETALGNYLLDHVLAGAMACNDATTICWYASQEAGFGGIVKRLTVNSKTKNADSARKVRDVLGLHKNQQQFDVLNILCFNRPSLGATT